MTVITTPASENSGSDAPLMLSVSGARGIVGRSMTPTVAAEFAAAFGSHVKATSGVNDPLICLGRDSRPGGEVLAAAAMAGLASVGCRVIELGVVMTPTVGVMVEQLGAAGGLVITASHNPIEWNGLKCLGSPGVALSAEDAEAVIDRFHRRDFTSVGSTNLSPADHHDNATALHIRRVLEQTDIESIRAANFRVVLDSVNGAGCEGGRMLLEELGCEVIQLNGDATGHFAHTPEPVRENLSDLAKTVVAEKATCGFGQDPDGDRLAIVDQRGTFIGEEYTLVLAADRVLARQSSGGGVIAVNLSTSRMIDTLVSNYSEVRVIRTPVGEANVAAAMREHAAIIGGEGNGGVIFPPVSLVRDSLSAMALVLEHLAMKRHPLSDIVDTLPHYEMVKHKFNLEAVGGRDAIESVLEKTKTAFADERIDDSDGVRIDFTDGWVHLRPSNTEPIMRLIAEAPDREQAENLINRLTAVANL